MKNILFVMPSLGSGGAEKSLVNLLNLIDYKKYAVDLLLFKQEGLFLTQIPALSIVPLKRMCSCTPTIENPSPLL